MAELSTGFPPIVAPNAHSLILGSMPSVKSLQQQQYYAHPRNAFWPIMAALFDFDLKADYSVRCQQLSQNGLAVWDVLQQCVRQGSLDQHIEKDTIVSNNFSVFLTDNHQISRIFFNGSAAEQLFKRHVLQTLPQDKQHLTMLRLPSTSPAHAAKSIQQKQFVWQQALQIKRKE